MSSPNPNSDHYSLIYSLTIHLITIHIMRISLAAANAPLLIEIDPENGVLITTGNELLAGEIKLLGE